MRSVRTDGPLNKSLSSKRDRATTGRWIVHADVVHRVEFGVDRFVIVAITWIIPVHIEMLRAVCLFNELTCGDVPVVCGRERELEFVKSTDREGKVLWREAMLPNCGTERGD